MKSGFTSVMNDVVNTLMDGADGLVLAAETAIGEYPIQCVKMIQALIQQFEARRATPKLGAAPPSSGLITPHGGRLMEHIRYDYDMADLNELVLAYATTVHKAQGSEYPAIIIPLLTQHFIMLQRNLIYTSITRAKELVVIVGTKEALGIAIRNNRAIERNSYLAGRLQEAFELKETHTLGRTLVNPHFLERARLPQEP